ncbi:MAG: S8 family serine peptidase [Bacteroidia bacterium]|nr:S8 family serine peptidase [Bacteroidia bacterium]
MKRLLYIALVALVFTACSDDNSNGPVSSGTTGSTLGKSGAAMHHLIAYKGSASAMTSAVQAAGGTVRKNFSALKIAVVEGLSEAQAATLRANSTIGTVVRDQYITWVPSYAASRTTPQSGALIQNLLPNGNPENAFFYNAYQWNLRAIEANNAWPTTTGNSEVRVGILDTGISPDHQDLAGKYDLTRSINLSWSNSADPTDYQDRHFHGTHVSGTIASNNIGTAGVAPDVTLVGVKVLGDDGSADFEDVINAILYAADPNGGDCDIINMSLGGYGPRALIGGELLSLLTEAVNYARSQGTLVVCSAGNSAMDLDHNGNIVVLPVEAGTSMGVSATGPTQGQNPDGFACYSNYGRSTIAVAAPGGNFDCATGNAVVQDLVMAPFAPYVANQLGLPNPTTWYVFAAGTSMAAPHVSGVAALIKSRNPNANAGQMQTKLQNTADDLGSPGVDPYYGKGRINARRAVQ